MLVQEQKKKEYPCCPNPDCRKPILGAFTLQDHWYSNYRCGRWAKEKKLVPADFQVSLLVPV